MVRRSAPWAFLVVLTCLLAACGSEPTAAVAPRAATAAGDQAALVDGQRVQATARVVAVPGRPVRLCANVPESTEGYAPGQEPAPAYCDVGVDIVGLDITTAAQTRTKDDATEGQVTVTGTLSDGVLTVEQQGAPVYPSPAPDAAAPCPEPTGGWPEGPMTEEQREAFDAYRDGHPDLFVALVQPAAGVSVVGIAVPDDTGRAAAEAALRPTLGDLLCLVDARYSATDVEAARTDPVLYPTAADGLVYAIGTGSRGDVQPTVDVQTFWVTPELRAAADAHPVGLVVFEPDLRPV